jgi:hypothetical protein
MIHQFAFWFYAIAQLLLFIWGCVGGGRISYIGAIASYITMLCGYIITIGQRLTSHNPTYLSGRRAIQTEHLLWEHLSNPLLKTNQSWLHANSESPEGVELSTLALSSLVSEESCAPEDNVIVRAVKVFWHIFNTVRYFGAVNRIFRTDPFKHTTQYPLPTLCFSASSSWCSAVCLSALCTQFGASSTMNPFPGGNGSLDNRKNRKNIICTEVDS